jgi:hypothetical protein
VVEVVVLQELDQELLVVLVEVVLVVQSRNWLELMLAGCKYRRWRWRLEMEEVMVLVKLVEKEL